MNLIHVRCCEFHGGKTFYAHIPQEDADEHGIKSVISTLTVHTSIDNVAPPTWFRIVSVLTDGKYLPASTFRIINNHDFVFDLYKGPDGYGFREFMGDEYTFQYHIPHGKKKPEIVPTDGTRQKLAQRGIEFGIVKGSRDDATRLTNGRTYYIPRKGYAYMQGVPAAHAFGDDVFTGARLRFLSESPSSPQCSPPR